MISIEKCEFFNSKLQIFLMGTDKWQESSRKSKNHSDIVS
jgi:hypothetical protein